MPRGTSSEVAEWSLIERERELAQIDESLDLARAGTGRVLIVTGPAGIGKTELLAAASGGAGEAGFQVCEAVGGELERDLAWGVVHRLFATVVRTGHGADEDLFAGAAALALPVLALGQAGPGADALSPALHGLYWLTANLSERAPVFFAVDDAQWADPASLRFLHYMAARLTDLPVLLALTIRTGESGSREREAAFHAVGEVTLVEPAPLSVDAGGRMLSRAIGRSTAPEFARACHAATAGNPFLLSELGLQLVADRIEPTAEAARFVHEVSVRSVSHWVLLRLSRLPADARRLAEAVAVLSGSAELAHAAALADLDAAAARELADRLASAGVLDPGAPLRFTHPLVRAAVYADIPPLARDAAHVRAAHLLSDAGRDLDAVASQLMQTHPAGDDWVVETLIAAATSARDSGAPEAAVSSLRRALAEPPKGEPRAEMMLRLGMAEAEASNPAAIEDLRQAYELAPRLGQRGRAALTLSWLLHHRHRYVEAFELGRGALAEVSGRDHQLELLLQAVTATAWLMDSSIASAGNERPRLPPPPSGNTLGERMVLPPIAAASLFAAGQPASHATELLRQALDDERFWEAWSAVAPQFWLAMFVLHVADELDLAEHFEQLALELARRKGSVPSLCTAAHYHSALCIQRGWLRRAEAEVDDAERLGAEAWPQGQPLWTYVRLEALIEQGRIDDAAAEAGRLDVDSASSTSFPHLLALHSRGRLRVVQGRFAEALDDLFFVGRTSTTQNPAVFGWRSRAAPALAALGRADEARTLLAEELELARTSGVARPIGLNLRATGILEGGDAGIELLRESVRALEGCPSLLERAHSLVELGSALRRSGRRRESVPSLQEGLELADEAGAATLAERARRELRDAGARPHRRAHLGRDELTPSELRVAHMAAEGATNKEIAQGLFVSLRTVETHLTHSYAKLGIASRDELGSALAANSSHPPDSAGGRSSRSS